VELSNLLETLKNIPEKRRVILPKRNIQLFYYRSFYSKCGTDRYVVDAVSHDRDIVPDSSTSIHDEVPTYPGVPQLQGGRDN